MITKLILSLIFIPTIIISGCSTKGAKKANAHRTVVVIGDTPPAEEPNPAWEQKTVTSGPDGSEITVTSDEAGTRVETRTFQDHPLIESIQIRTLMDQTKVGFVYTKNGERRPLTDSQVALSMVASGADLALSFGLVAPGTNSEPKQTVAVTGPQNGSLGPAITAKTVPVPVAERRAESEQAPRVATGLPAAQDGEAERVARLQRDLNFPSASSR